MRSVRLASIAAILILATVGCGSNSGSTPGSTSGADGSTSAPDATDSALPSGPTVVVPAAGGGSCKVEISGGATVSFESKQDTGTLQMDYWLTPDARSALALGDTDEGFLMNCQGGDLGSVSFLTTEGTTADTFAKGPATYKIRAQLGNATAAAPGQVQTLLNLKDKNIWGATEEGTFTVTKLDGSHFAGTFSVKIGTTGSSSLSATLTGSFDLNCINGACS
jgi:hypothetical protein